MIEYEEISSIRLIKGTKKLFKSLKWEFAEKYRDFIYSLIFDRKNARLVVKNDILLQIKEDLLQKKAEIDSQLAYISQLEKGILPPEAVKRTETAEERHYSYQDLRESIPSWLNTTDISYFHSFAERIYNCSDGEYAPLCDKFNSEILKILTEKGIDGDLLKNAIKKDLLVSILKDLALEIPEDAEVMV